MSQPTRLKTNCTSHETLSGNHSSQTKRKHHMFPAWEDGWAPLVLSATPALPAGEHYWQCHLQKQRTASAIQRKTRHMGRWGWWLDQQSPYLGSWTGAIMYSVSCAGGPQHSSRQKAITCQVISEGQKLPLSPPPSHPSPVPPFWPITTASRVRLRQWPLGYNLQMFSNLLAPLPQCLLLFIELHKIRVAGLLKKKIIM